MAPKPDLKRFWAKVLSTDCGCWVWLGAPRGPFGYGTFTYAGKQWMAHRFSWQLRYGECPDLLDHICNVPQCVNPDHLQSSNMRDNTLRSEVAPSALNARKTHCPEGHPYDAVHAYNGARYCRACYNARQARNARRRYQHSHR
jgi:hypothetical protein